MAEPASQTVTVSFITTLPADAQLDAIARLNEAIRGVCDRNGAPLAHFTVREQSSCGLDVREPSGISLPDNR